MDSDIVPGDLIDLGLSEKEAQVYITLIQTGVSTVTELADASGLKRSSIYSIVDTLKEKGLVSTVEETKVQKLVATSPEILTKVAERALKQEQEKLEKIQNILPELKGIHKDTEHRPKVRILEGVDGLISALNETLTTQEKVIRAFTSGENLLNLIPEHLISWTKERIEKEIEIDIIYVDNEASKQILEIEPKLGKVVLVPQNNYPFPVDMMLWDNKVGYLIPEGDSITSIIIESKETALVMKNMFDMALEQARADGGRYLEV